MGLTVDDVLDKIGSFGRYQFRLLLIFGFMYLFGNSILVMIPTFLSIEPPWRCKEGSSACNLTGIFKPGDHNYNFRCSISRDDWEFDTNEITNSVVTEVSPASLLVDTRTTTNTSWRFDFISFFRVLSKNRQPGNDKTIFSI